MSYNRMILCALCGLIFAAGFIIALSSIVAGILWMGEPAQPTFRTVKNAMPETVDPQNQLAKEPKTNGPTIMTRADAKKKFIGMTTDELRQQIGNPTDTIDQTTGALWHYPGMTIDESNGKKDAHLQFRIDKGGKVKSLTCY